MPALPRLLLCLGLLLQAPAFASQPPELVCDSDAGLRFEQSVLGGDSVQLSREDGSTLRLPWSGRALVLSGRELKAMAKGEQELESLGDETSFYALPIRKGVPLLLIQRELLKGDDDTGGLVLARNPRGFTGYNCRRR